MRKTMLVKVDSDANNNKFYEVTLFDDGRVQKRWGRVGLEGQSSTEMTGERGYNKAISAKKRKGYEEVTTVDSSREADSVRKNELGSLARQALLKDPNLEDKRILTLVDMLVQQNRHQIIANSGGMIEVNADGVMQTALGIIDPKSIEAARSVLVDVEKFTGDVDSKEYKSLIERYLTLVPQKVAAQRGWHKTFFADDRISKQMDFLEQLEKSYEWYEQSRKAASTEKSKKKPTFEEGMFRYKLDILEDAKELAQIEKFFRSSANSFHGARVNNAKINNVYTMDDSESAAKLEEIGNVKTLWHGSRVYNVLSILSKGLLLRKALATAQVAGSMFGHGLYFSNQSTKSALYSAGGTWSHGVDYKWYMFVVDVAMGNEYKPGLGYQGKPFYNSILTGTTKDSTGRRYDSINVASGHGGVRNHEAIVPGPDQVRLKYLVEFDS